MQIAIEQIAQMAHKLSPFEKIELVRIIMSDIHYLIKSTFPVRKSLDSAYGICADYKPEPSDEDIAQMRKEVFKDFRQEDMCI
jgi:hypothetical protein